MNKIIVALISLLNIDCTYNLKQLSDSKINNKCNLDYDKEYYEEAIIFCNESIKRGYKEFNLVLGDLYFNLAKEKMLITPYLKEKRNFDYYRLIENNLGKAIDCYELYIRENGMNEELENNIEEILTFRKLNNLEEKIFMKH